MNGNMKRVGMAVSGLMLVAGTMVYGNGFRNPPETAAGLGLDGGRLNLTEDASAVAVNPAALADLKKNDAVAGLTLIHTETDYEGPGGSATTDDPWKLLPNAFAAFPTSEGGPVVGVGLTTPFGQSTIWEKDSVFRYTAPYEAELMVVNVNPSVGYRVNKVLSVGAGVDLYSSQLTFKQLIPWGMEIPGAGDGTLKFDADGDGWGWNVGARLNIGEKQRVSVSYRSAVEVEYDGDFETSGTPPPVAATGLGRDSDFSSEIEFPAILVVGYGVDLNERWQVGVDAEWVEFSTYDSLPVDIEENNVLLDGPAIPQNWDDIWTFGAGTAYKIQDNLTLRAGYKYMPSPIPSETLAPTLPDADKHQVSLGLGFTQGAHRVDVAYAYAILDERDITDNLNPAYNGQYDSSSHILALTYGLTF